jgi:hypothetical protein
MKWQMFGTKYIGADSYYTPLEIQEANSFDEAVNQSRSLHIHDRTIVDGAQFMEGVC